MEDVNISKSILSISSPGTAIYVDSIKSTKLTRDCNSFAAQLKKQYPDRIGFWASLPLPFIDETLKEVEVAISEGADGFGLLTNYQGYYLGDPLFEPVMKALNEKNAKIFVHPTMPCAKEYGSETVDPTIQHTNSSATPLGKAYPIPMFEFFFDTARAACNLLLRGVVKNNPLLTFILPHASGAFPPLLSRISMFSTLVPEAFPPESGVISTSEEEVRGWLNSRFYFDLAGVVFPGQLKGMLAIMGVKAERLLYGSDYPFTPVVGVMLLAEVMDKGLPELFGENVTQMVLSGNAKTMLSGS
jgi:predicted TIM-barrel fold metal-dependent hydrolase